MENDEVKTEDVDLSKQNNEPEPVVDNTPEPEDDYRGKLNATNRFLEKEGYKFVDGRWVKPEPKIEIRPKAEEPPKVETTRQLSDEDLIYLAKADIHSDDIDDVKKYARSMNISVSEAHKFMQPILEVRKEERRTANATTVKGSPRGTNKLDGEALLRKAEQTGEVPETAEAMQALFQARQARRLRR